MSFCKFANQDRYPFKLPELPYGKADFEPYITAEAFEYHHGKHHNSYVTNLNNLVEQSGEMKENNLEEIIIASRTLNPFVFNNAAQIWNHSFFWHSMKPAGGGIPKGEMLQKLEKDFLSYKSFSSQFKQMALEQFGSGWVWLVYQNKKLKIITTSNAQTPITEEGCFPLITCDVWEHAYYIDYRNKRAEYIDIFIEKMINWDFAYSNFLAAVENAKKSN